MDTAALPWTCVSSRITSGGPNSTHALLAVEDFLQFFANDVVSAVFSAWGHLVVIANGRYLLREWLCFGGSIKLFRHVVSVLVFYHTVLPSSIVLWLPIAGFSLGKRQPLP